MENIEKTRNSFIKKIDQNDLMNNKNKMVWTTLKYIKHFYTLLFAVAGCISISAFASLVDISTGIFSSTIELNNCEIIV